MTDLLRIKDLTVDCIIGVYPHERHEAQPLSIDVEVHVDVAKAAKSEDLADTVDYAALVDELTFLVQAARFRLVETACHAIARYVQLRTSRQLPVHVRVRKTRALETAIVEVSTTLAPVPFAMQAWSAGTVWETPLRLIAIADGMLVVSRDKLLADDGVTGLDPVVQYRLR